MNRQESKKKITDLIDLKIKSELASDGEIIFDMAELFLAYRDINADREFMDSLCKEYEAKGFHMIYCYHVSFIWRHRIVISKSQIIGYEPRDGYVCGYFKTEKERKEFEKERDEFMKKFRSEND